MQFSHSLGWWGTFFLILGSCSLFAAGRSPQIIPEGLEIPLSPRLQPWREEIAWLMAPSAGEWSMPVNGLSGRLVLLRKHVFNGTPIISTHLQLRQVPSGRGVQYVPSGQKFSFQVTDKEGEKLPIPSAIAYSGAMWQPRALVIGSEIETENLTCSGLGVGPDYAALIDLGIVQDIDITCWNIPRDGKAYFLSGTMEVAVNRTIQNEDYWHGRLELLPVAIPVKALPIEPNRLTGLIQVLGMEMLEQYRKTTGEEAENILSIVEDPRVVPFYVQLVAKPSYSMKFRALNRLARFPGDEALAGIKIGLKTQAADLADPDPKKPELDEQLAGAIRQVAVSSLMRSRHPEAHALILSMRHDPYSAVRLEVVHYLGTVNTPESRTQLQEMSTDPDAIVSSEAKRILKQSQTK